MGRWERKGVFGGLKTTKTKGLGGPHRPPGPTPPYSTCARRLPLLLLHPKNLSLLVLAKPLELGYAARFQKTEKIANQRPLRLISNQFLMVPSMKVCRLAGGLPIRYK